MKSPVDAEYTWHLILRYVLGLIMVAYGFIKITGIQFMLPAEVYTFPLKDIDGVTLTWAFLGFSTWFSVLLGLFEFVPALLLLFRKTELLGAILLFPVLLTVFLINNAYGFLMYMRIFTGGLLMVNVVLISVHYKEIIKLFEELLQYQPGIRWAELMINAVLIGIIILFIAYYCH